MDLASFLIGFGLGLSATVAGVVTGFRLLLDGDEDEVVMPNRQ